MAKTWLGSAAAFPECQFAEGSNNYRVTRNKQQTLFSVANSGSEPWTVPVAGLIGGKRHGFSLLLSLDELGGIPLARPVRLEARYALSPAGALILSPGFPKQPPQDLEHTLGKVLSPAFEIRCLTCHGKPGTLGAGQAGGVRCESCHGPASAHVASLQSTEKDKQQIVKPASLHGANSMEVCAQCHSGFKPGSQSDPLPQDLLVSSQVPALRHSECFIQSGGQLTCTSCHNPHQDSAAVPQTSVAVCLRCHSLSVSGHAAICPVNQTQGCIGCHMPNAQLDSFRVADHWIRVQPDAAITHHTQDPTLRSQVIPKREFLRLIAVASDEDMKTVTDRLAKGDSFSSVAHDLSKDQSAAAGGFIGDMALADMNPALAAAAAHLAEDSDSGVIQVANNRVILHRLPRDFKWQADRLYHEALKLNDDGDRLAAIKKARQALDAYPYQLKGLVLMGIMLRQAGDVTRSLSFLGFAAQLYPQDAATQFDIAMAQNSEDQVTQLRHVLDLDPDILAVYRSLGTALQASGQRAAAIEAFRAGLQINPLSAVLYHDLGLALRAQGDTAAAENALALAARLGR